MTVSPPLAPRRRTRRRSSKHLVDPWQWLEKIEDKQTLRYLKEENRYYNSIMEPYADLKEKIFAELKSRVAEDDSSIPERDGEFWYYVRFVKDLQYPLYCRKKGDLATEEIVYLDHNLLAKDKEFCDLGFVDVSPDHRYVAFGVDEAGEEKYTVLIKDMETGELLPERIDNTSSCLEWKGNEGFFYVILDDLDRPTTVLYHKLGTPSQQDIVIYKEKDSSYFVGLEGSESDAYIFILCHAYDSSEVYAHAVSAPDLEFHLVARREPQHEYEVTHQGDRFLILTNDEADNYRLVSAPLHDPSRDNWQELVAHDPDTLLEGVVAYEKFIVLAERRLRKTRLRVIPNQGMSFFLIEFDEEAYELGISAGRDYGTESFRVWYSTPRIPQTCYDFNVFTGEKTFIKQRPIADPSFKPELYTVKSVWAKARDGEKIPLTLLYRNDQRLEAPQPLFLHGYGSYGETLDCDFSSYRLSLVDRGFIYAMAHIRGGMEMGRRWYLQGKLEHKWNSFNDFIDASEFLIREGWTAPKQIIAEGASAGGMLMGVVANERPDLYLGLIASVPFVDVLNTMLDPDLPLTTLEYQEWGNPADPRYYELIKSYSPYDNVKEQEYPHMLVIAGLHDKRVMYWEAAKWVAKLRSMKKDSNLLLLKTEENAGHGGASGRYDALWELAEELCFALMLKERFMK